MATGDQNDMFGRLKDNLVPWFGDTPKNLDILLQGPAKINSEIYDDIQYVNLQARIKTATDINLDYIALDYLGSRFTRHKGENDESFRVRILANLIQQKATRYGMIDVLTKLTGRVPIVIEGFFTGNIGAYDQSLYYDQQGGSGFLGPYIAIIYVFRPQPLGFLNYGGYDFVSNVDGAFGYDFLLNNAYVDISQQVITVTDDDILYAIENTKVFGTYIYTFIFD